MEPLPFFDCNCMFGRRTAPRPESNLSDSQILEDLERAGITRALAMHAWGKEYDPHTGNERLVDLCREHRQLVPCFAVLPDGCGDFPAGDALLYYLRQGGARAVCIYPRAHSYGLGRTWAGRLLENLAEAQVPLLIDLEQTSWPELDTMLSEHSALQVVVLRTGYRINRWVFPMLARYPGLHLETSFYQAYRGIEAVAIRFGADRLLFGTGLPAWDPGGPISALVYADLPDSDRQQIAGRALEGLLWKGRER